MGKASMAFRRGRLTSLNNNSQNFGSCSRCAMDVLHDHLQGACKKQGNCGEDQGVAVECIVNENPGNVPTCRRLVIMLISGSQRSQTSPQTVDLVHYADQSCMFVSKMRRSERRRPLAWMLICGCLMSLRSSVSAKQHALNAWNTSVSHRCVPVIQLLMRTHAVARAAHKRWLSRCVGVRGFASFANSSHSCYSMRS